MKIDTDTLFPVYVGLSIAVGILGFIVVSLITYTLMPTFGHLRDFMQFMCGAGWVSIWIIYITAYAFAAHIGWLYLEKRLYNQ